MSSRYRRTGTLLVTIVAIALGRPAGAQDAAGAASPATFILNTKSDIAKAAFDDGFTALLENDLARAAAQFQRSFAADSQLRLARAYEISVRGRSAATADEVDRLRVRNGAPNLIETLQFMYLREWQQVRPTATALLNATSRIAPAETRLLEQFHWALALGSPNRIAIARTLRDRDPGAYRPHAYVALALPIADSVEASRAVAEALRLGADRPFAHWVAGELATRLQRYDEARAHYTRALELDSNYYRAATGRAAVALYTGKPADARRDLDLVHRRATYSVDLAVARRAAAITWLHAGDVDRAIREMNRVAGEFASEGRWRSQIAIAHQQIAFMALVKRDAATVERHLREQAAVLGPDDGTVRLAAATCRALLAQPEKARAELTAYEQLVAAGTHVPAAGEVAAITALVLGAEGKHNEALESAGNSTSAFAVIAAYQALKALGREQQGLERLKPLVSSRSYVVESLPVPLARAMYGAP